ncbi:hypothetical protein [Amycolatopsis cihanbeyliensis]|uniref:Uncharacterized protein n=1 Tax=Amycolatopsis cihanbeyliensis TaxID=1128664 RepID=A0A542DMA5_AMYCI|nr:hypothetical protein [Amycolatopsis cihanbeyliensis]TQJ04114.1 hypothetical protein FB471_3895 [Amycolatopsis cihanbeyliensis]
MFATILTWIGAVLGIAVLLAMAFGTYVFDLGDAFRRRRPEPAQDQSELPEGTPSSSASA